LKVAHESHEFARKESFERVICKYFWAYTIRPYRAYFKVQDIAKVCNSDRLGDFIILLLQK